MVNSAILCGPTLKTNDTIWKYSTCMLKGEQKTWKARITRWFVVELLLFEFIAVPNMQYFQSISKLNC